MIEESKYYADIMKKHFNKDLLMTKKDYEDFKNSTKFGICDHVYVEGDIQVRDHSAHRDCNINVKSNHKISIVFHNLKNDDSHHILLYTN